jgi:hypothetical protein
MTEYDIPTGPLSTAVFLAISDDAEKVWFTEPIQRIEPAPEAQYRQYKNLLVEWRYVTKHDT